MLYASSRSGVLATAEKNAGVVCAKRIEAGDPAEITQQSVWEEFYPRVEVDKRGFDRPKRPGRR